MKAARALEEVLSRPDIWCGNRFSSAAIPTVSSGFAALDAELPGGGWPRGALTEILLEGTGLGECSLLLPALTRIQQEGRWGLLVAPPHRVHGPAWSSAGVDLAHVAVVASSRQRDALWATEQALSSGALGMVLSWATCTDAQQLRRLQVAAARGNTLMFLFRPTQARQSSSAASLRLVLHPGSHGALDIEILKRRGAPFSRSLSLEVPRPLKWREQHEFASETTLACPPSAFPAARCLRPLVLA
jgi:cell division inhibitor SulA/protein ImuA